MASCLLLFFAPLAENTSMTVVETSRASAGKPMVGWVMLLGLLALVAGGKSILYGTLDPDCFWHMRVAEQLCRDGIGPIVDELSFASLRTPWTPYSWLAELGMKWLWDVGGFRAAIAAEATLVAAIVVLLGLACRETSATGETSAAGKASATGETRATGSLLPVSDPTDHGPASSPQHKPRLLAATVATAFGAFWCLPYLSFRPATAAIALLTLCTWLLLRDRRLGERTTAVWAIPPLTALLVNIHLYAIMVPMWIGALLLGAIWERRTQCIKDSRPLCFELHSEQRGRESLMRRRIRRYALLVLLSGIACLMTPMLPGLVRTAMHYQFGDPMVASRRIAELQPFWTDGMGKIAAALVLAFLFALAWNRRRVRAGEWLWLALSAVMLLRLGRFMLLFAPIAAPLLALTLPTLSDRVLGRRLIRVALAGVLIAAVLRIGMGFPDGHVDFYKWLNRDRGPDARSYPSAAADFVLQHITPSSKRIVNEFTWGGYLAWHLAGHYQVLLDGRTQLYPRELWQTVYLGDDEQQRMAFLADTHADAAVLPREKSRFRSSLETLGWTSVFQDELAEVMVPPRHP